MKKLLLSFLLLSIVSCGKNQDDEPAETLVFEELKSAALNVSDLEVFENCGNDLPPESVNYCSIMPDTVEIGGIYVAAAKFLINKSPSPTFEPSDSAYKWIVTGDGIGISKTDEQFIVIKIERNFTQGTLESTVVTTGGGGSSFNELVLKKN